MGDDQKFPLRVSSCLQFQCGKAEQHREAVLLSAAFQAWKLFKDHQLWWTEMNGVAAGYHRWAGWLAAASCLGARQPVFPSGLMRILASSSLEAPGAKLGRV